MTAFCVIAVSVIFFYLIKNFSDIMKWISSAIGSILPITVGFIVAYLLHPILKILEYQCFYPLLKRKFHRIENPKKTAHTLAAVCSILIFLLAVFLFFYLIIPQLYISIIQLISDIDDYYRTLSKWFDGLLADYPQVIPVINELLGTAADSLQDFAQKTLLPVISSYMSQIASGLITVVIGIKNVLLGLIIAIYVMLYEKKLASGCKKLIASFFAPKTANRIFFLTRKADSIFSGFISGKILDSVIIGILCFILMSIFRIPYAVLISVLVCVTNIIPFFGPFIGAIPSCLLLLLVDPWQALYFGILILVLQQFDGNVLGPKILGDSTGLNAFWVVVVILVGGSLAGFAGMLLGLPTFAFFYSILKEYMAKRTDKKQLPQDELAYEELQELDPQTGEFIRYSRYPTDEELLQHSFRQQLSNMVNRQKDKLSRLRARFSKKS